LLLENGADPTHADNKGRTPLPIAQENDKQDCVAAIEKFPQRRRQAENKSDQSGVHRESSRCSSLADNVNENQGTAAQVEQLPQQVNATVAPNAEAIQPLRPPMTDDIQRILTCTISGDIMQDPVILFPSGNTFDRKPLCKWLLAP
jgi:hypothetical protein